MELEIFQVDAFTSRVFGGNPAAVVPLKKWLPEATLQAIALENNLSETAFFVKKGEYYELRWFTPETEIDLCGHATLGTAYVLFEFKRYTDACIVFETQSGRLFVDREGDLLSMDFPAWQPKPLPTPAGLCEALGAGPSRSWSPAICWPCSRPRTRSGRCGPISAAWSAWRPPAWWPRPRERTTTSCPGPSARP